MRTAAGNFKSRKRDPLVGERAELSLRYVVRNQEEGMYYLQNVKKYVVFVVLRFDSNEPYINGKCLQKYIVSTY